ncbi:DUF6643 family protein [Streptomyces sp. NPDC057638]|uniref:DUF6643 family protein n=1 Tax=Streptomyces sp. NPDC057638 TaxID=3346190 RepID=UPI0036A8E04D
MTSPRASYGGGYYSAPFFADTPIYDSLVAERGTPQIAPIRVPSAYDTGSHLPALPAALPALPAGPSSAHSAPGYGYGYPQTPAAPVPLQQAPAPYIPQQQPPAPRGYPAPAPYPQPQQRPAPTGYEAMRPAAHRPAPAPAPAPYQDPYNRPHPGQGY